MAWTRFAYTCLKPGDNSWQKPERKRITYIFLYFSAVTNINSWKEKSALSNVVSLAVIYVPTDSFTSFWLLNPSKKPPALHEISRSPNFEASKLWKDRPGYNHQSCEIWLPTWADIVFRLWLDNFATLKDLYKPWIPEKSEWSIFEISFL